MSRLTLFLFMLLSILVLPQTLLAQSDSSIHVNQIGYYPDAPKVAAVVGAGASEFHIIEAASGDTVFTDALSGERFYEHADQNVRLAEFSDVTEAGTYRMGIPELGMSHPFAIEEGIHRRVGIAAVRAFYFQRASIELEEEYAGPWAREAGHPDDSVLVHSSAATTDRPEGTVIEAPKGWYDAGDYNKYIVNSGISTGTLLSFYEDYPGYAEHIEVHIPEVEEGLPAVLDETLWNLRWMLTMQDPHEGGVYHKLTAANFESVVMPDEATSTRYVVQKGTAAALNFAAVMAQASRVYASYLPELSDSMRTASLAAWGWARLHPDSLYRQNEMNQHHDPDIETGAYGDDDVSDEFAWAAAELYITTGQDSFFTSVDVISNDEIRIPTWSDVQSLAYHTLIRHRAELTDAAEEEVDQLIGRYMSHAEDLAERAESSAYGTVMGQEESDFAWGSNSVAANQGIALLMAHSLTQEQRFLDAALSNLDYLLGRNATGFSFVTGYGHRTPMHPHHRPSEASRFHEPVPGLLAGGPNPGQQDGCDYPSDLPALSYVDHWCSYASNEIAINWNAPLMYLANGIEAFWGE